MKMKHLLWICTVTIVAMVAAWGTAKLVFKHRSLVEETALLFSPAPGRIEFVTIDILSANPEKYDGKRLITGGLWFSGAQENYLVTYGEKIAPPDIGIRLQFDWSKLKEPFGDLSKNANIPLLALSDWLLIAEGTFSNRKDEVNRGVLFVDRIYCRDPVNEKEPGM